MARAEATRFTPKLEGTALARPWQTLKDRWQSPDTKGRAEEYFSSSKSSERKRLLLSELINSAAVLTEISFDLENNLHFYMTAPEVEVKEKLLGLAFPKNSNSESSLQKMTRIGQEILSRKATMPDSKAENGAREVWRRRVYMAISVFLAERQKIFDIEFFINNDEQFAGEVIYNETFIHPPEFIYTPVAVVAILDEDDYNKFVQKHFFSGMEPGDNPNQGLNIVTHDRLPQLNGRFVVVKKDNSQSGQTGQREIILHELFHSYFTSFIRRQNLNKHQEPLTNLPPLLDKKAADICTKYAFEQASSVFLEEACAYLFNTFVPTIPDNAQAIEWEVLADKFEVELKPHISHQEYQQAMKNLRAKQSQYLHESRTMRVFLEKLVEQKSTTSSDLEETERPIRNVLFLLSQTSPTQVANTPGRFGAQKEALQKSQEEQQTQLERVLEEYNQTLISGTDVQIAQAVESLKLHMHQLHFLYTDYCLPIFIKTCLLSLQTSINKELLNQLLRVLENSIVARNEALPFEEEVLLQMIEAQLERPERKLKLRLHLKILRKIRENYEK